jgi:hypothetical protein
MAKGGLEAVRADEHVVAASRVRELEAKVRELERLLGRKTMEAEIVREALEQTRPKKTRVALAVSAAGRFWGFLQFNKIERECRQSKVAVTPSSNRISGSPKLWTSTCVHVRRVMRHVLAVELYDRVLEDRREA